MIRLPTAGLSAAALFVFSFLLAAPAGAQVVISQIYGGGGNSGAPYSHDFVELFNAGAAPASLAGMSLRYGSATGNFPNNGNNYFELPADTIPAGGYYLVQMAPGNNTSLPGLPAPDAEGAATMSGTNGKVVLVNSTGDFACGGNNACSPAQMAQIVDLVGFGSAGFYEGSGATPTLSNSTAGHRLDAGCQDSDDNAADFEVAAPAPRNSATPANPCGGAGGDPVLSIADASLPEGNAGLSAMAFQVTLSAPAPAGGIAFTASTADGSAQAPDDYIALVDAPFLIAQDQTTTTVNVQIVGNTVPEPDKTFTVTIDTAASGVVLGQAIATGTIINDDALTLEIFQIQGDGLRSPYAPASGNDIGQAVSTQQNVVTAIASNGFFMQTPDARDDNNPATSNGIFVFTGSAPAVAIGDLVDVSGNVQEYFDWTQITQATVTVTGQGELPTPVVLDAHTPSPDMASLTCGDTNFECLENMRVHVPAGAVVQGSQYINASTPFAEAFVTASGERAAREPGLLPNAVPPVAGLPVWDGNPEVFELDVSGAGALPLNTPIFGGELFEATGVIAYQFGNYALRPVELVRVEAELPRPVPEAGDGELRVGSFNTLNLCQSNCNVGSSQLDRLSDYVGNVLRLPDVLALQEVANPNGAQVMATRLNTDFGTDYSVAHLGSTPHGTGGQRLAYLVRDSRVEVLEAFELREHVMITDCSGTPPCVLHDRPPQLLVGSFSAGDGELFAVLNNHTRSLIGIGDNNANGQRVRSKRFQQAQEIATIAQNFQLGLPLDPDDSSDPVLPDTSALPLILVGDYNAFGFSDGYVDVVGLIAGLYDDADNEYRLDGPNIVDPPLSILVHGLPAEEQYSYTFREDLGDLIGEQPRNVGSIQVLDHALVNEVAQPWCSGLVYGRGNADAPTRLRNIGTDAIASSDHDGFVVRLHPDRLFRHDFEQVGQCR